jgi:hypothetical protein
MTPKQKRAEIKRILSLLTEASQLTFKLMYNHNDLDRDINLVVDEMPNKQLDWALKQCEVTYHSIFNILKQL